MALNPMERRLARLSLAAVWLWTAAVSVQQLHGFSAELLRANAHIPPQAHARIIWSGAAVDALLGGLMLWRPAPWVYRCAGAMTLIMTLIGTAVDPGLWLQPLGPLSKNLPILALLWMLARDPSANE
jgi:hypothetical protein